MLTFEKYRFHAGAFQAEEWEALPGAWGGLLS